MNDAHHDRSAAARLFLTLAADGSEAAAEQRSVPRRLGIFLTALLLVFAAPLAWVSSANGDGDDGPQAVLVKSSSDDDDDDDDDATGGDDSGKTGTNSGTGQGTDDTGDGTQTRGKTGEQSDAKTGNETQAQKTDKRGVHTGKSTRGETDPGDHTGKTERR